MNISVIVPWRSTGDLHREAAWQRCRPQWWGRQGSEVDDGGEPFSRAASINLGVARYSADVYVVADSDILVDQVQVQRAIELAASLPGLVIAFERWAHLTEEGTRRVIDGYRGSWEPYVDASIDWSVSACIALSHETWETTGGFDPRFRAWGMEDVAFEIACRTLAGPTRRVPGTAWHLYHPTERNRPQANVDLLGQYREADGKVAQLRSLMARV